ncbi:hypothetical protein ISCGN_021682 [Ixodes scapularis]
MPELVAEALGVLGLTHDRSRSKFKIVVCKAVAAQFKGGEPWRHGVHATKHSGNMNLEPTRKPAAGQEDRASANHSDRWIPFESVMRRA